MSTDYVPDQKIPYSEIKTFNHRGVRVDEIDEHENIILTDGTNYLHACPRSEVETLKISKKKLEVISRHPYEGVVFTRYGGNNPDRIIGAIEDYFNVRLISEHDGEFEGIVSHRKSSSIIRGKEEGSVTQKWSDEEVKSFKLLLRKMWDKLEYQEDAKELRVVAKLLTEIDPNDHEAWHYLGVTNGILGAFDEARDNLYHSLELGGHKYSNYFQLSNVFMSRGDIKEAIKWGYKALKCDTENVSIYHKIADLHLLDGDTGRAIKVLESLLKVPALREEDLYNVLIRAGNLCMNTQRMKKALDYFEEAQKLNPADGSLWTDIGHCLSRSGDTEGALSAFKKAASANPSPHNLYNLGDAYLASNMPERAIPPLVEATRKDPSYALAHYDLSLAFIRMGKYQEGVSASIAALRSDPEMKFQQTNLGMGAMNNLGLCLMNLGRHEEALECFRRNKRLLGGNFFFNTGLTLFRMKRYKEALEHFFRALEVSPGDPEYLNLAGQTYEKLGKRKTGEKYLRESIKKDPKYALGYYDLGVILAKSKTRRREALSCFTKAIKLDPQMPWAYYSIACIHALSGDKEKALAYLEQSFKKGLRDKKHIDSDADMDSLRHDKEFTKMMAKYFNHS